MKETPLIITDDLYIMTCPHCTMVSICLKTELNCKIFRCGIFKASFGQIGQHLTEEHARALKNADLIYGCSCQYMVDLNKGFVIACTGL